MFFGELAVCGELGLFSVFCVAEKGVGFLFLPSEEGWILAFAGVGV